MCGASRCVPGTGGAGRFRRRGRWAIGGRSEAEAEPRGRLDVLRDRKLPEDETTGGVALCLSEENNEGFFLFICCFTTFFRLWSAELLSALQRPRQETGGQGGKEGIWETEKDVRVRQDGSEELLADMLSQQRI